MQKEFIEIKQLYRNKDEYIDKKGNVVKKITSYYPLYE